MGSVGSAITVVSVPLKYILTSECCYSVYQWKPNIMVADLGHPSIISFEYFHFDSVKTKRSHILACLDRISRLSNRTLRSSQDYHLQLAR